MKQLLTTVIGAVIIAILVGSSAPWWWPLVHPTPSASAKGEKKEPPQATASPTQSARSAKAQPAPYAGFRSKLLIKGSFNEVYVYWGDVAMRREPFTVTTTDEHSHIMLPENLPVDIEFDGHDNIVWCHSRDMVGQIIGDGLRGNKFEVR